MKMRVNVLIVTEANEDVQKVAEAAVAKAQLGQPDGPGRLVGYLAEALLHRHEVIWSRSLTDAEMANEEIRSATDREAFQVVHHCLGHRRRVLLEYVQGG